MQLKGKCFRSETAWLFALVVEKECVRKSAAMEAGRGPVGIIVITWGIWWSALIVAAKLQGIGALKTLFRLTKAHFGDVPARLPRGVFL